MTGTQPPSSTPLERSLKNAHRGVLAILGVSALVIATHSAPETATTPSRDLTFAAIGLAAGAILLRRVPLARPRAHIGFTLGSMLCAAGLGLLGVVAALTEGQRSIGLLYTLAGAILWLRPPVLRAADASR